MWIYDTQKREKVKLEPADGQTMRIYTCGPTVYNYAHIGNLRTYLFEDLLRRTIQYVGYHVFQVMNLTDVDDKTIRGALQKGVTLDAFTKTYKDAFFQDLHKLNIEPAEVYPSATDHIKEMIVIIQGLIDKGVAYVGSDGNVFFRIAKFPSYGKLAHFCIDDLQAGASTRVTGDEYDKESISDFVLWKAYDDQRDGDIYWESPWGKGRPGWHIECSAMAMHYLGETFDLHVGGVDNIFPHHENEIAQSECHTGKTFARHWMHSSHLIVDNKKMSKSLGNFFTLRDLLDKEYTGQEVRYLLISTHYRTQLNFTLTGLDAARGALGRIEGFRERMQEIQERGQDAQGEVSAEIREYLIESAKAFQEALEDDLNISEALAVLFGCIRKMNQLADNEGVNSSCAASVLTLLGRFDSVLGLMAPTSALSVPEHLLKLLDERNAARAAKSWAEADRLRAAIEAAGYIIEDAALGSKLKKA